MKRILTAVVLAGAFMFMFNTAHAQKFGYVNSAAILEAMPDVKQAEANLEALQKQLQKKGQGMLEQLQQEYIEVQKKMEAGQLSPQQQEQEAQRLKQKEMEIAKFEQDMINQIDQKRTSLLAPIYDKINNAIEAVAKENGFQFIFDQAVLLYGEQSQDVSSKVRAKLGM